MTLIQTLRVIGRLIAIDFAGVMAYRAAFLIFMLSTITTPLISLLIWRAALASGADLPVSEEYLTTYFVLLSVIKMLTGSWMSGFLAEQIRMGQLSIWLVRPGSTLLGMIANNLSEKTFKFVVLMPMIGIAWWFVRDDVVIPGDPLRWLLAAVSVVLAGIIVFCMDIIMGSLAFWLEDVNGLNLGRSLLAEVLSGAIVPLALMPAALSGVLDAQPFRYTVSFPLEILVSGLDATALATGFAVQLGWCAVLLAGSWAVWQRGQRAYTAVGA